MNNSPMAEALRPLASRMPQVVREREILRVAGTLGGANVPQSAEAARQEVLTWAAGRSGGALPAEALQHQSFEHLAGGRNCTGVRISSAEMDLWAIRADDPDKYVARRSWTTEVTIGHMKGQRARFSIRLLVSSPEQNLEIEPAVPSLVNEIATRCGLERNGMALRDDYFIIESNDDAETLIDMLVDSARDLPVFVLTVPDLADDPHMPLIDPGSLARATLGLAHVVVMPAQFTWALTDRFGKKLSVYGGAVRVYLPGFTEDADPYAGHQLVLRERLTTPTATAGCAKWLRQLAASESVRRLRLGADVLSFAAIRSTSLDLQRDRLETEGADDTKQLDAARAQIAALKEDLRKAQETEQWLLEEHAAIEDRAKVAESQLRSSAYRIQQLADQIKQRGESPDANIQMPNSWADFAEWCEQSLAGRVALSARASRELRSPSFQDPQTAAKCLLWLANDYRERRLDGGNGNLHDQPVAEGIRNERCGADAFQIDWQGRREDVDWHIKNGGNTRSPSRCLRIYYFWDDTTHQVVIASMPAHITSGAS